jgi:hypothetical protein
MSDKEKSKGKVWFVRGVSIELRAEVAAAAERAGMNIGPWVVRALRAALERPEGQGGARVGQGDAGDLAERVADLAATVEVVRALFEKHRRQDFPSVVERIERLEAAQAVPTIPGRQGRQGSALDAFESAEGVEMPEKTEARPRPSVAGRRRSPRPWTDADWIELRRIFDRGGTQAEAERELSRPSSVISRRWRELEQERAG